LCGSEQGPLFSGGDEADAYGGVFLLQGKGLKTRLNGAPLPTHNKSDECMLTRSCGQTALAIARFKA